MRGFSQKHVLDVQNRRLLEMSSHKRGTGIRKQRYCDQQGKLLPERFAKHQARNGFSTVRHLSPIRSPDHLSDIWSEITSADSKISSPTASFLLCWNPGAFRGRWKTWSIAEGEFLGETAERPRKAREFCFYFYIFEVLVMCVHVSRLDLHLNIFHESIFNSLCMVRRMRQALLECPFLKSLGAAFRLSRQGRKATRLHGEAEIFSVSLDPHSSCRVSDQFTQSHSSISRISAFI
jgi:hypothetical protein